MGRLQSWNPVNANFSGSGQASSAAARGFTSLTAGAQNIHRQILADAAEANKVERQRRVDAQRQQALDYHQKRQDAADAMTKTLFDQKQGDRRATGLFYDALDAPKKNVLDFANNEIVQKHVQDATLTPTENKMLTGVKDLGNSSEATATMKKHGYSDGAIQGLLGKYRRGLALGDHINKAADSEVMLQTRGEMADDAMNKLRASGLQIPTSIQNKYDAIKAAEVSARILNKKTLETQIAALGKSRDKTLLEKAKATSKGTGTVGHSKGSGKSYLDKDTTPLQALYDLKKKVSPLGNGLDSSHVEDNYKALVSKGILPDKAIYMLNNAVDPGFLGNHLVNDSDKAFSNALRQASKQYDKQYNRSSYGGSRKGDTSGFDSIASKQLAQEQNLAVKLSRLGKSTKDVRTDELNRIFGAIQPTRRSSSILAGPALNKPSVATAPSTPSVQNVPLLSQDKRVAISNAVQATAPLIHDLWKTVFKVPESVLGSYTNDAPPAFVRGSGGKGGSFSGGKWHPSKVLPIMDHHQIAEDF